MEDNWDLHAVVRGCAAATTTTTTSDYNISRGDDVYKPKPQQIAVSISKPHNPNPRSKRRKIHVKKVCHVAAHNLSSSDDMWSWRKYGQKPIKGSPYPRGYYKCSTSKACMARKQVERNKSDPGMFIVTYTAEHNHPIPTHRNSLAGTTRHKLAEPEPEAKLDSSIEDLPEIEDDDDVAVTATDMPLDDDFFAGLEHLTDPNPNPNPNPDGANSLCWT